MNYTFTKQCRTLDAAKIWSFMQRGLSRDVIVQSIQQKIHYTIHEISNEYIRFSAPSRNDGEPETIFKEDFVIVVERLQKAGIFNTQTAKELFKGKGMQIYKKRSPLFSLLLAASVIEKVV